jgi:NAD(P)-dependent dehydrogenase (short-subunit alcohol dehydrogenase family)
MPGLTRKMRPVPDHGEHDYKGSGRLKAKKAIITGGDSGIGRAVAIAYAREGADVLVSYLQEHEDAEETKRLVESAGRKAVLVPGDIQDPAHCRKIAEKAVAELGGIDILVNNAAHQASFNDIGEISDEEWELTFKVNIHAMFYLTKAAVPHMSPAVPSSTRRPSIPMSPIRSCSPTPPPREPSRTSRPDWRSCWPRRAFVPTPLRQARSGRP